MSNVGHKSVSQRIADRIKGAKIAGKLQAHIEDPEKTPLLPTQITAARILLAKVSPDMKQVESIIKDERKKTREQIDAQLVANGIDPEVIWQSHAKH